MRTPARLGLQGRLESLAAAAAQFDRAIDAGHGDEDIAAAVYASLAG